jgi:hypothetical protein
MDPTARIGRNCRIGPNVTIGPNVVVGDGVRLQRCVLLSGVKVKDHAWIKSTIVGWNSTIGRWARLENVSVLGDDVTIGDEIYVNGGSILPHKSIKVNVDGECLTFTRTPRPPSHGLTEDRPQSRPSSCERAIGPSWRWRPTAAPQKRSGEKERTVLRPPISDGGGGVGSGGRRHYVAWGTAVHRTAGGPAAADALITSLLTSDPLPLPCSDLPPSWPFIRPSASAMPRRAASLCRAFFLQYRTWPCSRAAPLPFRFGAAGLGEEMAWGRGSVPGCLALLAVACFWCGAVPCSGLRWPGVV